MNSIVGAMNGLNAALYSSRAVAKYLSFVSNLSCNITLNLHDLIIMPAPNCSLNLRCLLTTEGYLYVNRCR